MRARPLPQHAGTLQLQLPPRPRPRPRHPHLPRHGRVRRGQRRVRAAVRQHTRLPDLQVTHLTSFAWSRPICSAAAPATAAWTPSAWCARTRTSAGRVGGAVGVASSVSTPRARTTAPVSRVSFVKCLLVLQIICLSSPPRKLYLAQATSWRQTTTRAGTSTSARGRTGAAATRAPTPVGGITGILGPNISDLSALLK